MQWPTEYFLYKKQPASGPEDVNIPISTKEKGGNGRDRLDLDVNEDVQRQRYFERFEVDDGTAVDTAKPQIFAPGHSTLSQAVVPPVSGSTAFPSACAASTPSFKVTCTAPSPPSMKMPMGTT
jgi:hypothetical protein